MMTTVFFLFLKNDSMDRFPKQVAQGAITMILVRLLSCRLKGFVFSALSLRNVCPKVCKPADLFTHFCVFSSLENCRTSPDGDKNEYLHNEKFSSG